MQAWVGRVEAWAGRDPSEQHVRCRSAAMQHQRRYDAICAAQCTASAASDLPGSSPLKLLDLSQLLSCQARLPPTAWSAARGATSHPRRAGAPSPAAPSRSAGDREGMGCPVDCKLACEHFPAGLIAAGSFLLQRGFQNHDCASRSDRRICKALVDLLLLPHLLPKLVDAVGQAPNLGLAHLPARGCRRALAEVREEVQAVGITHCCAGRKRSFIPHIGHQMKPPPVHASAPTLM